jgi:hypothetical protein
MIPPREWFYFGCGRRESGHYLWDTRGGRPRLQPEHRQLGHFDGALCAPEGEGLYLATLSRLGGIGPNGYTALAWWDRSQDTRPASNSIIFCPSRESSAQTCVDGLRQFFPWVWDRLPQPLAFHRSIGCDLILRRISPNGWVEG